MNVQDQSKIESGDQPLFVLKYRRSGVLLRGLLLLFLLGIFVPMSFVALMTTLSGLWLVLGIIVFGCCIAALIILAVLDVLFFQEIRLYHDKIVRVCKLRGETRIKLTDAKISINRSSGDMNLRKFAPIYLIFMRDQATKKRIVCDESLAEWEDVRKLRRWLARISGRRIEEFEEGTILREEKLMRISEADSRKAIRDYTLYNDLMHESRGLRQYNRRTKWAFFVAIIFIMLGPCVLWFLILWRAR
jgi:hypothetical protein